MSYDVDIGNYWWNYTSNLAEFFYKYIPDGIPGLDGLTGAQAYDLIMESLLDVKHDVISLADKKEKIPDKYDPDNGWGSTFGAVLALVQLAYECKKRPRQKLKVNY